MAGEALTGVAQIRAGAAQYSFDELDSIDAWREKVGDWVAQGAKRGAQILVFPEYGAIEQAGALGRDVSGDLGATLKAVAELEAERVAHHVELARAHDVHILVGSGPGVGDDGAFYNRAQLIAPSGRVGVQSKLMMTPFERDWGIKAGRAVRVFDTVLGRIGVAICYDVEFPLIARAMACAGADILLVPSCTERVSGYHRVRTGGMARALENTIAVVHSPTVGDALWSPAVDTNCGAAGFYVPPECAVSDTGVLEQGELDQPGWVVCDIDMDSMRHARSSGEMRNFADWNDQPGGGALKLPDVEVVSLRS